MNGERLLKPFWQRVFRSDFSFIIITFIVLGFIRFIGLANHGINIVTLGFLIMWVLPIIFLSNQGRREIGIKRPGSWLWVLLSFIIGAIFAGIIYYIGYFLYGTSIENWGMTVVNEYLAAPGGVIEPAVFIIVVFLSMLFSPIGEELYFRGIIHKVLDNKLSSYKLAGFWSSLAFAIIHIPHHDIFFADQSFVSILIPLTLWVVIMFLVSYLFIYAREKSDSILGAIFCHSGYILGMNLFVYFVLL